MVTTECKIRSNRKYSSRIGCLEHIRTGIGRIKIDKRSKTNLILLRILFAIKTLTSKSEKPKSLKCCTFGASNVEARHLATGDFDGNLQIWDLENLHAPIYSVKAHSEIINSIDGVAGLGIGEGAPEIVTASRDGKTPFSSVFHFLTKTI